MTKRGSLTSAPLEEIPRYAKFPLGGEHEGGSKEKPVCQCQMEKSEYSICEAVRNGDRLAIEQAYWKSMEVVQWHVEKVGGWWKRPRSSKDYAHDAWVVLLTKLQAGMDCKVLPDGSFYAYLKGIAYNLFLVSERGVKRNQAFLDQLAEEIHEDVEFDVEKNDVLRKVRLEYALGQLSKSDRLVLERHVIEEVGYGELAKSSGKTPEAVRQQYHRAKENLETILKEMKINGTWV